MKRLSHAVFLTLMCLVSFSAWAVSGSYVAIPSRSGVKVPVWLIAPDSATGIVILFSGGGGILGITDSGIKHKGNFLVRTRQKFARQGMIVAIPDKPDDRAELFEFRTTQEHAEDISAVMKYLRQHYPAKPLWLVGTSRGTISVASVAARLHGKDGPEGIVLTSSLTRDGRSGYNSLRDINLSAITVPSLVVHNKKDECQFTPFSDAESLPGQLSGVKVKAFKAFDGGMTKSKPCQAKSYHGYLGIEEEVVEYIVDWIKSH